MKIKLLKQYGISTAGTVLDPEKNIADLLIGRGVAEPVKAEMEEIAASIAMPIEAGIIKAKRKPKKAKRK